MSTGLRVEHIAFNVADADAMAAWYCEHLDMSVARKGNPATGMCFLADATGRVVLELYSSPEAEVPDYAKLNPFTLHLAFATPDAAAAREKLVAAGATPIGDVDTTPEGDRLCMLRDPWGLTVQFCQRAIPMEA